MIIISHKSCMDGMASAWVCKKRYPTAEVYFAQYGEPMPEIPYYSSVIMVDFSYPREQLEKLHNQVEKRLIVLDHHKTAQKDLDGLPYAQFDMNECGATLAWEYCFPDVERPLILDYVKDRDLWLWALPNSREVSAALQLHVQTFEDFNTLEIDSLIKDGITILSYQRKMVNSLSDKAKIEDVGGYSVPTVNSPVLQSEIGERLLELYPQHPFAAIYFQLDLNTRVFSLRSRKDFDVSVVAKTFGGGGHAQAAGFKV
jgi:oligoribonuclease NrnB/cAMP/cGMP phosphodiesterase (DHH superfamily)